MLSNFRITTATGCRTLDAAAARARQVLFQHGGDSKHTAAEDLVQQSILTDLAINVAECSEQPPQLGIDESYTLAIPAAGGGSLNCATVYGCIHGLQSFTQLSRYDPDEDAVFMDAVPLRIVMNFPIQKHCNPACKF